jgi:hypothetical protein
MFANLMIHYVNHKDIDQKKWDKMVGTSSRGEIFSFSWYLNAFCIWDALVLGDYEAGIALPVQNRFFIRQFYQPTFVQKCVWTGNKVPIDLLERINQLAAKSHINTNIAVPTAQTRDNFILNLDVDYERIKSRFSTNVKRNLKKHTSLQLENCTPAVAWDIYQQTYGHLQNAITHPQFTSLIDLIKEKPDYFAIKAVVKNQTTIAFGLWAVNADHQRIHYLMGAPTFEGKKNAAMTFLHNEMINIYASKAFSIYDFEGSSIPSVATFYKKFGAQNEPFFEIEQFNNPFIVGIVRLYRMFKKS